MINVTPYIDKLELLKEWLFYKIDDRRFSFQINFGAISHFTAEDLIRMYNETGVLFYRGDGHKEQPTVTMVPFEEFYKLRIADLQSSK